MNKLATSLKSISMHKEKLFVIPIFVCSLTTRQFAKKYDANVINRLHNPQNVGSLDKKSEDVGTGLVGSPSCGDVLKLQIQVKEGTIEKAVFKVKHF
jgi:hypothetical protein